MLLENLLKSNNEKVESLIIEEKRIKSLVSIDDNNENENENEKINGDKMNIEIGEIEISNSDNQQKITVSAENTVSSLSNNTEMDIQESIPDKQNISSSESNGNEAISDIMNISETISVLPILKDNITVTQNNGIETITVVEVSNTVTDINNEKLIITKKEEKEINESLIEVENDVRNKENSELKEKKVITNEILSLPSSKANTDNNINNKDENIIVLDKTNETSNITASNLTSTSSSTSIKIPLSAIGQETDIQNNEIDPISVKMEIVENNTVTIIENEKIAEEKYHFKIENLNENENNNNNKVLLSKKIYNEDEINSNNCDNKNNENGIEIEQINVSDKIKISSNMKHNFITMNNDNNINDNGDNKTNIPQYSLHLPEITRITSLSKHSLAENNDNEKSFDEKTEIKMKNDVDYQNTSTSFTTSSFVGYRTPM